MRRACALVALLGAGWPSDARAYNCATARNGITQVWVQRCIGYSIKANSALSMPAMRAQVDDAFAAWYRFPCTNLLPTDLGTSTGEPGFDPNSAADQTNIVF